MSKPEPAPSRSALGPVDTKKSGRGSGRTRCIKAEQSEHRAAFASAQAAILLKVSPQCALPSIAPINGRLR